MGKQLSKQERQQKEKESMQKRQAAKNKQFGIWIAVISVLLVLAMLITSVRF